MIYFTKSIWWFIKIMHFITNKLENCSTFDFIDRYHLKIDVTSNLWNWGFCSIRKGKMYWDKTKSCCRLNGVSTN